LADYPAPSLGALHQEIGHVVLGPVPAEMEPQLMDRPLRGVGPGDTFFSRDHPVFRIENLVNGVGCGLLTERPLLSGQGRRTRWIERQKKTAPSK